MKETHFIPILSKSSVFSDIPKQTGYAVQFNFNQTVLMYIGCLLSKVGMSFRHVDDVLIQLSKIDFTKINQTYSEYLEVLEEFKAQDKDYVVSKEEFEEQQKNIHNIAYIYPISQDEAKSKIRGAEVISRSRIVTKRKEPIQAEKIDRNWLLRNPDINSTVSVQIDLEDVVSKVARLFAG